jgi:glyoxylase-like metal-dependent hydrolase (beta-lactamase superfamily II)
MRRRGFLGRMASLAAYWTSTGMEARADVVRPSEARAVGGETPNTLLPGGTIPLSHGLNELWPGVYAFKDTCNVYAIVKNGNAILIDFGSGNILRELPSVGVQKIEWILHTHFHRNQAQGDGLAKAQGIKLAVPATERKYFDDVEAFWDQKKVFVLYDMRNEFLALRKNIATDYGLKPGTTFSWNGIELQVIATPGHTEGSLSFLLEHEGKRLLFCGDLVASEGKVPTMHDLEWPYVGTAGIAAEMESLNIKVRAYMPHALLPSRGNPSKNPLGWTPTLLTELSTIYYKYDWARTSQQRPGRGSPQGLVGPRQITKHIWQMWQASGRSVGYLIVADSGHAMLLDINAGETRYLDQMQKITGFRTIDHIVPSHYHEDHVGGINAVRNKYGAEVWAMDHMVDVLEHPAAYNLPCLWPDPVKVDRILHDGESVVWESIPMRFFYLPGQTEYTEGVLMEIDGRKLLFDGDNVGRPLPGTPLIGHYVCRNYQRLDTGHVYSAKKLLELEPDYVCPQHFEWDKATRELLESYLKASEETNAAFKKIIDQPDPEIGLDNNWASFYPYQVEAKPGDTLRYELRIRNWIYRTSHVKAVIVVPENWVAVPESVDLMVPAKSESSATFAVKIPRSEGRLNRRFVLTADIWRDDEHLGELTEALVNMQPMKFH